MRLQIQGRKHTHHLVNAGSVAVRNAARPAMPHQLTGSMQLCNCTARQNTQNSMTLVNKLTFTYCRQSG